MALPFNSQSPAAPSAPARLPCPGDRAAAARVLEGLRTAVVDAGLAGTTASAALDRPQDLALLEAVVGNSPYLGGLALREPATILDLLDRGPNAVAAEILTGLAAVAEGDDRAPDLMRRLRVAKRRMALAVGVADIAGLWSLERVTGALSDLAQASLRLACRHVLRKAHGAGQLRLPDPEAPETGSGLIVLAMGKFGAGELNYSSDIDLMVLYDDGVAPAPPDDMQRTFVRLTRELVRLMEERTADGYVFRTDLRLRPDPGATPPAVFVSAAETYYGSLGQNWERAAMIKARPVAGDPQAGAGFMELIRHFVWRRSLDFHAVQDIHSIKWQIGTHRGHRQTAVNGHNIKIGRGGIREIEFFAQTQQLIFGGRDPSLRRPGTVAALEALVTAGHVPAEVATELSGCYRFLRQVEHRLQMVDDQQTHALPESDEGVAAIAGFLGYDAVEAFRRDLLTTLATVERHYAHLFEETPDLGGPGNLVFTGTEDDPETLATLGRLGFANAPAVAGAIRGWHHGRYRATRSTRARELLTELTPTLLEVLGGTPQPDQAFLSFDEFLARLPAGVQVFSLFHANPKLLELVAEIMGTAPRLAEILARRPAELEAVLSPDFFDPLPTRGALDGTCRRTLADARCFEETLLAVRRWTNEQRFRAGVHILRHITDADRCGPFLTAVAEVALCTLQGAVEAEFRRLHGGFPGAGFCVLALGRLGAGSMSLRSDLDLITVYDLGDLAGAADGTLLSDGPKPLTPQTYFTRLTQRLIAAVTAQTGEGQLYDVDMRLRPSGNAGPLAVSLEAFRRYQTGEAWTWEHMALTRARPVTGPEPLRTALADTIREILARPRDPDRLLADVAEMRDRIAREHGTDDPFEVKHVRGGMVDIQFIAQYLTLRHAADRPEIVAANTTDALARLAAAGLLDRDDAAGLIGAQRLWRRVQGFLRLTVEGGFRSAEAPAALRQGLARAAFPPDGGSDSTAQAPAINALAPVDFAELERRLRATAARVRAVFDRLIAEPAARLAPPATDAATQQERHAP